jgi:hypothetical protein
LRLDHQSFLEQAREQAIERARLQLDPTARALGGLAHDGVAVPFTMQQHEQHVERIGLEREQLLRATLRRRTGHGHLYTLCL